MTTAFASMVGILVLVGASALLLTRELRLRALNARVERAVTGVPGQSAPFRDMVEWLFALGTKYRRFYSPENLEQLRTVAQASGLNPHRMMPIIIAGKTLSMFLFPTVAAIGSALMGASLNDRLVIIVLAVAVGILAPGLVLRLIGRRFNAAVQRGTPDAIDLLVVCSEAGMGLESGLERVAQEMGRSNPPMSKVLNGLLDDLRVLPNRQDAFVNLGARSTSEGLRRVGTMLKQSMQYGTPLSDVLRAVADELRRERITRLEERAHKLGAKLIIPMVIFMLPAMFIILAASPFLHLMESMKSVGN
jgi:tight adherence protein C